MLSIPLIQKVQKGSPPNSIVPLIQFSKGKEFSKGVKCTDITAMPSLVCKYTTYPYKYELNWSFFYNQVH